MYRKHPMDQKKVPQTGAMELYPRDTDDMRVVLETGHVRRKTSATGVTWKRKLIGLRSTGETEIWKLNENPGCPNILIQVGP